MITEKDIGVVRLPADPDWPSIHTTFEGSLRLSARRMVLTDSLEEASRALMTGDIALKTEAMLKRMIMNKVYGDLREPLNKLFDYAHRGRYLSPNHRSNKDYAEIMDIRQKLRAFL